MASQREGAPVAARKKFLVLVTASLVSSMIMLDSNIVAVSLPAIARSLHASFADIEWVVSAYVLTFAALLMAAGSYADRHGRKLAVLLGLAVFAVASGLCGLATSAIMLNLARALQGVGASLLVTAALALINHAFDGAERAKAIRLLGFLHRYLHHQRPHYWRNHYQSSGVALGLSHKSAYLRYPDYSVLLQTVRIF